MGLSDILPNGFKSFCWRPYTKVSLDYPCFTWCVFAPTITIASNHNLVKVLSGSSAEAMCIKQISSLATREIGFFVHCPIPIVIFPCPACCFEWHASRRRKASGVLGSLEMILVAYGQARNGLIPHLKQHEGCPDTSVHTKGKWQIAPAWWNLPSLCFILISTPRQ